ncbi:MAG: hypothetical protein ACODAJ_05135 [Planctomycetota bacterium]
MRNPPGSLTRAGCLAVVLSVGTGAVATEGKGPWGHLPGMYGYSKCFRLDPDASNEVKANATRGWVLRGAYKAVMIRSNAPGNVYHEGEQPEFTLQLENLTANPIQVRGTVEAIRYSQSGRPGSQWYPELRRLADVGSIPIQVALPAKGWQNLTIRPAMAGTKGGYGYVVDLGPSGRQFLTSAVRTFQPSLERVQFPRQSLEHMPPAILERLGVQAIRYGVSFILPDEGRRYERLTERLEHDLAEMHAHKVTCTAEFGAGTRRQPLGRGRPHLDENGVMRKTKQDLAWLPKYDDEFQDFVYELVSKWGWPKGPITGVMLWNEPWEGISISGWGADMLRYRRIYRHMCDAVFLARKEADVDVLVGGCDSSTNTWDKLFGEGIDRSPFWPEYLDFCSIHYQGLAAPVLYPAWNQREHYKGRVRIWDTESWTANTDDRFLGVVAANRAAGYDRALGSLSRIAVATLSHHRTAVDDIRTEDGTKRIERHIESRPLAAAYGACQHFIGERAFKEILFKTGVPWVFVFDGLDGNPDDGTVVVVGELAPLFGGKKGQGVLFRGVRSLAEVEAEAKLRQKLAGLAQDAPERAEIEQQIAEEMPYEGASMTLPASPGYSLYDVYGNPVPAEGDRITIPLSARGFFFRADPEREGSFARLLAAIRKARIEGIEPLEIVAYDMTAPVAARPTLRLRLTSQLNRPVQGALSVKLDDLKVEHPQTLSFTSRERKQVEVEVVGGAPSPDNTYPLSVRFDAGDDGVAVHHEPMHVNVIHRRTIAVDGQLDDWKGALPQTIDARGPGGPSFAEAMWLPFQTFEAGKARGVAVAYLAADDRYFYFAAKIADDSAHPGTVRHATLDDRRYFYPQVSYSVNKQGEKVEHRWPAGVRRFSYRRNPDLPSGPPWFDNVLIGFNAIPMGEDGWLAHLPGRMPRFTIYKSTDYQFALNKVAEDFGGGTEIWRLEVPGMPRKHFYPRQPEHPKEGPAKGGKLVVRYTEGTRIVECAVPWSEIPHVEARREAGETVKFSFRVNDDRRGPIMELARDRSACQGLSNAFHPDWSQHWPNELEFAFER